MSSVLITAASDLQAYRVQKFLGVNASFGEEALIAAAGSVLLPATSSPSFIHEFLDVCLSGGYSLVYALRYQEQLLLSEAVQLFEEYGIELFIHNKNTLLVKECAEGKIELASNGTEPSKGLFYRNVEGILKPFYLC